MGKKLENRFSMTGIAATTVLSESHMKMKSVKQNENAETNSMNENR